MDATCQTSQAALILSLIILLGGLQAVACGVWSQMLALARGHPGIKWFWIGFFLSAGGVVWASNLPDFYPDEQQCRRRSICSRLCAVVNGCADEEQAERE